MTSHAVRNAGPADAAAMTNILIASAGDDPCYDYRFPNRKSHPKVFAHYMRIRCEKYIDDSEVYVCEETDGTRGVRRVVAFAVYECPWLMEVAKQPALKPEGAGTKANGSDATTADAYATERLDANKARVEEFRRASNKAKTRLFDVPHGQHLFLKLLLCHPAYRRRGYGAALVQHGIDGATERHMHTTLFASPMGKLLYLRLGFKQVGQFRVHVPGDSESDDLELPAMEHRWDTNTKKRRQSTWSLEKPARSAINMAARITQSVCDTDLHLPIYSTTF